MISQRRRITGSKAMLLASDNKLAAHSRAPASPEIILEPTGGEEAASLPQRVPAKIRVNNVGAVLQAKTNAGAVPQAKPNVGAVPQAKIKAVVLVQPTEPQASRPFINKL